MIYISNKDYKEIIKYCIEGLSYEKPMGTGKDTFPVPDDFYKINNQAEFICKKL